ncbi:DUF1553 domain-containing protein [Rubripirellula amarantea]|nr:DUF1553 domain-containing protein [Rubripirellula amarantea]
MRYAALALIFGCTFWVVPAVAEYPGDVRWDFSSEEATELKIHGNVLRDQAGPRPPEFPDFADNNTAVQIDGGYLAVPDVGANSVFDFTTDDSVTLEAWVNPNDIRNGEPRYVIGKGRTGSPNSSRDNQNWALRIVGKNSQASISFLFATKLTANDKHWHRWTSNQSFPVATGWHHIAVTYRFGDPSSIRGYINGEPTDGKWDMGGPTEEPPIVDDDEVRIGSRFKGLIDAVAIHREVLDDQTIAAKFRRVGEPRVAVLQREVMPDVSGVPEGRVVVQLCEGLPTHQRWLYKSESWPDETLRWTSDSFVMSQLPQQFDAWGIRSSWKAPLLLRMAADVDLPVGTNRFLKRVRDQSRLWIDGELVARTEAQTKSPPDGEEQMTPVARPPLPGVRAHGYRQQEVFGEATIASDSNEASRRCRVVLEWVVGGKGRRTETGEVCVAILGEDGRSYDVLAANERRVSLTDSAVLAELTRLASTISEFDDDRRRAAADSQNAFWNRRHEKARQWVSQNSLTTKPWADQHPTNQYPTVQHLERSPKGQNPNDQNLIDQFISDKIEASLAASAESDSEQVEHFHGEVLPLLREQCFRCHGDKDKGDLKLNSREAAMMAGESEIPAVVPGDLDASELISQIREGAMPPTDEGLSHDQIATLERWVANGALWPSPPLAETDVALARVTGDEKFLRRVFLDTIGVPPTQEEARRFLDDHRSEKRQRVIDQLIEDPRFADHWMGFWQDLLAENPSLLNASLNSTGPFRWFVYDSLRDNKPIDRMVTELLMLRGDAAEGGSAGFGIAAENDAPMAAKGHVIASAFLGIELQCARCHDSPYHSTSQRDLYSLAAMMDRKAVTVPSTSRVPAAFFESQTDRESLIQVTLKPDEAVTPKWPFASVTGVNDGPDIDALMMTPSDTRERLAALVTAPSNTRFSQVLVNRIWKQLIGVGIVEPVHDWEGRQASHPELLQWLAAELVSHDYDFRHIVRLIVTSDLYQREAVGNNATVAAELRFFNAPERRRLTAEQVVDSLHHAAGQPIDVEELTFVHDGRRPLGSRQTLGRPRRAWMFGDLKNERDRPSLSLPKARAVVDVLEAFGWTGSRQMPIVQRETDPNVLQPGILANGILVMTLARASHDSELARLALEAESPSSLVESLFLRCLGRLPTSDERDTFVHALASGFESRLIAEPDVSELVQLKPLPLVTWFNHLRPEANEIQVEHERRVQSGPLPDPRLETEWREVYEDVVWSLLNHREFVWIP